MVIRRAIDDARRLDAQGRAVTYEVTVEHVADVARDFDVAARLDDDIKLRQFVEGLKERLTKRELEAAVLCYIHGYSRPEAAEILSVEPKRMEKIMDGVSKKVGGFVRRIETGAWCDSRRSLMNAYAFGVLDRNGERHRLASEHRRAVRPAGATSGLPRASQRSFRRSRCRSPRAPARRTWSEGCSSSCTSSSTLAPTRPTRSARRPVWW
jgi:hypothetical protein